MTAAQQPADAALERALAPWLPGVRVERVTETGSTNSDLLERARRDGASGLPGLLVADRQCAGRGRRGRTWQAAPGCSLTFSLALPLARLDWCGLSLAVGVAVAEALDGAGGDRIGLKWPNDLWLREPGGGGRKLGGILIESIARGSLRVAVVGIGINVLPQDVVDASTGVACWREIEPAATTETALARVAPALAAALVAFERAGYAPFAARYAARDVLRGLPVRTSGDAAVAGIAAGVSPRGALLVDGAHGRTAVESGEVSVRLAEPAAPC